MNEPVKLMYLNNNRDILDFCEPYYINKTFTKIPTEMKDIIKTVEVLRSLDENTDVLVYDYKIYSDNPETLNKISNACNEIMLKLEIENGPIQIYTYLIGDTLDLTFTFTDTEEFKTYRSIKELHNTIIEQSRGIKLDMTLHIQAYCENHEGDLIDLMITTNLFRSLGYETNLVSDFNAVFYPTEKGKLAEEDYTSLAVILGKAINSTLNVTIVLEDGLEYDLDKLLETYCKINKERMNRYLEYKIESRLLQNI